MGLLDAIIKFIFGFSSNQGASATIQLGTGYSVEKDMEQEAAKLIQLQEEAIAQFPPQGKTTHCNEGLMYIADGLGCRDLDGMNATCMVQHVQQLCITHSHDWREDSWERAVAHAARGGFAFFGMEAPPGDVHGHVVSIAAKSMEMSGTWGQEVPICANIGKTNGFMRLSQCFRLDEKPMLKCFLWKS